ncbi:hypothetical protein [Egbenema bharatensis]
MPKSISVNTEFAPSYCNDHQHEDLLKGAIALNCRIEWLVNGW